MSLFGRQKPQMQVAAPARTSRCLSFTLDFHVPLRRMCALLFLGGGFYVVNWGKLVDNGLKSSISLLIFRPLIPSVALGGVLQSLTVITALSVLPFHLLNVFRSSRSINLRMLELKNSSPCRAQF